MKLITCYGGDYSVTRDGKIYNKSGLCMSQKNDSKGRYMMINLSFKGKKKMFLVHRLVAMAYIERIEGKNTVNHIDGNKHNNSASNLEWCTQSENLKHSYHDLGNKFKPCMLGKKGSNHNRSVLTIVESPDGIIYEFGSGLEMSREIGLSNSAVSHARRNKLPHTFKWGVNKGWVLIK